MLLNVGGLTSNVTNIALASLLPARRVMLKEVELYLLSPHCDGASDCLETQRTALNGEELLLNRDGDLPPLVPRAAATTGLVLPPFSLAFIIV